jgi:hypothetical protein
MDLEETKSRMTAGEGQQQFNRSTNQYTVHQYMKLHVGFKALGFYLCIGLRGRNILVVPCRIGT